MTPTQTTDTAIIWQQIEYFSKQGVNMIPVDNEKRAARQWKKYQSQSNPISELWNQCSAQNLFAVAIIAGRISGNLEIIDIDIKNWPGIEARLFSDLREVLPDIWNRLRIHKTPSGGYHILYRIASGEVPGNRKLVAREGNNPKTNKPYEAAIESRGEGGYAVAPPSLNYSVYQDRDIPTLSWEERESLMAIITGYDERRKQEQVVYTKKESTYYDENPFDHFNKSADAHNVLSDAGWTAIKQNNRFIWYTRPGGSKGHIHASYNKEKFCFWIFTTGAELEGNKGYLPSTVLSITQHGGDRKRTYEFLVQRGYGKIKRKWEMQAVSRGQKLPANASAEAIQKQQEHAAKQAQIHPFGTFWDLSDDGCKINREKMYDVSASLGFRNHEGSIVRIIPPFIYESNEREYFDIIKEYIHEPEPDTRQEICNCYEDFLQKSGRFTSTRLPILDTDSIITDEPTVAYKFYRNGMLEITRDGPQLLPYTDDQLVWDNLTIPRDFHTGAATGKYTQYLDLAIGISSYLRQIIGYLAHDYKDEITGYIIVLTEICADPKQGGGTGKNIFGNIFNLITSVATVAGSQISWKDNKLLQSWNRERIFFMADVDDKFDFLYLKELSTGYGVEKKLFKDERRIGPNDMPKILVNTNYSYEVSDGGLRRRIKPVEFTNFFNQNGGVDAYFGGTFPTQRHHRHHCWTPEDWSAFDNFIAQCISEWLAAGKIGEVELTLTGWEKQFKQEFKENTWQFIVDNIDDWVAKGRVEIQHFNDSYTKFCNEANVSTMYRASAKKLNEAIERYCARFGIHYTKSHQEKINGLKLNYKLFTTDQNNQTPF